MKQCNGSELSVPSFLNNDFLLDIIRRTKNDPSITLCHGFKLRPVTDECSSNESTFRATLHYRSNRFHQERAIDLVVKTPLNDKPSSSTEFRMYTKVLPTMTKMLEDAGEPFHHPRLISAMQKPHSVLVIEDVSWLGWTANKLGLNTFQDVIPMIQEIAKLHAASYNLNQKSCDLTAFNKTLFPRDMNGIHDSISTNIERFCDTIQTRKDCEKLVSKFQKLKPSLDAKLNHVYAVNPNDSGYNVLNYASVHTLNILHKTDYAGRVTKTMLTNFQSCSWGSPAIDLLFILNVVVCHDIKLSHRNEIIYEYYRQFVRILTKLGYLGSVPSLVDLHTELLKKSFFEVYLNIIFDEASYIGPSEDHLNQLNYNGEKYLENIIADMHTLMFKGCLNC
ncbi:uncharacterized protein LOC129778464 [Toxorhynchites rutilus septentrionalis]|uniref:uncharacterized protein LOC129778464 n=1 Tax=Toxorhynchites rutilus septentrionalis TaxID=329112 RepID=UPI00247AAFBD|nr:uncharacterized protein LOC129778464 [Toxorhynchites rutilus septentrionalis]XP_055641341.1 uncharacterized protein LOC129778464 [Toxorhynchites rutilus septentrionalis]